MYFRVIRVGLVAKVGSSYGKLNREERDRYEKLNCNGAAVGDNPSCADVRLHPPRYLQLHTCRVKLLENKTYELSHIPSDKSCVLSDITNYNVNCDGICATNYVCLLDYTHIAGLLCLS